MPVPIDQLRRGSVCVAHNVSAADPAPHFVVLLQDARRLARDTVMVARLHVVTDEARSRAGFYDRLAAGQHPAALLVPQRRVQGASGDLYLNLLTIATVPKADLQERKGALTEEEMRQVSERLVKTLELDISRLIRPLVMPNRDPGRAQLPWWSRRSEADPRPATLEARQRRRRRT